MRSIRTGIFQVVLFFIFIFCSCSTLLFAAGVQEKVFVDKSTGIKFRLIKGGCFAMGNLFGRSAEVLFSLLIGFALFSSLSAFIIIGPRVYYSMAKDGLFFKSVAKIHPQFGVPSNSIILQCIIACILAMSGSFEQILTYMGFSLGIFPVLAVAGIFILRRSDPSALRLPGFPVAQVLYISAGIMMLTLSFLERPGESSVALATVAAGIPVYLIFRRISGKKP